MRKLGVFSLGALLSFAFVFTNLEKLDAKAEGIQVYVGGMSAGFTLKTGGVQIIGICEVVSENGVYSPANKAELRAGDTILKVENIEIDSVSQLNEIVNKGKNNTLNFEIARGDIVFCKSIQPIKDKITDRYKIGVLVRDSVSGVGTVTYIDRNNGRFGALGHSVVGENKKEMRISDGNVYACSIVGVNKGLRGRAGELRGMFLNDKLLGKAEKLCHCGIFGRVDSDFEYADLQQVNASSAEVKPGEAYIVSTVNGVCPKRYEIEIVKVDKNNKENKNYVIKIKDRELIEETGGIVQGMSGSPILQDNKLIGAITHVFLNDPTRGYGIDINTMLQE